MDRTVRRTLASRVLQDPAMNTVHLCRKTRYRVVISGMVGRGGLWRTRSTAVYPLKYLLYSAVDV